MNPHVPHRDPDIGSAFTLVEVVVALALATVLALASLHLIVHAQRTSATLAQRAAAEQQHAWPGELLGADLAARPAGSTLVLGPRGLRFASLNALQTERNAARHSIEVLYEAQSAATRVQLTRRERELGASTPGVAVPVARGLASAVFDVFDGQAWHATWPPAVPLAARAVRLRFGLLGESVQTCVVPLQPLTWRRHDE